VYFTKNGIILSYHSLQDRNKNDFLQLELENFTVTNTNIQAMSPMKSILILSW